VKANWYKRPREGKRDEEVKASSLKELERAAKKAASITLSL